MANFVLVHGGWHGGWCWAKVVKILRTRGHDVLTPTLTGLGERAHLLRADITLDTFVQDVLYVLEAEEMEDVVLVGHSIGAVAIAGVADRIPKRLSSLVFLDGLLLRNGETLADYFTPMQRTGYEAVKAIGGNSFAPPPAALFNVPDGPDADWVNRRLTPVPFGTVSSPMRLDHPIGNGLPCSYIASVLPAHPFVLEAHTLAKAQPNWRWREIATGHDSMITKPDLVADLLEELA